MDALPLNIPAATATAMAGLVSLGVLCWLFAKLSAGKPLLAYEPRRPVPWTFVAPLLMLGPSALGIVSNLAAPAPNHSTDDISAATCSTAMADIGDPVGISTARVVVARAIELEQLRLAGERTMGAMWSGSASRLFLTATCYVLLIVVFGASISDLGLPHNWRQLRRDAVVGVAACAASLLPIYAISYGLFLLLGPTRAHPLLEQYVAEPSPALMAAAAMAAFVTAPLFEETGFRLVFQGWLERCEARYWRQSTPAVIVPIDGEVLDEGELAAAREIAAADFHRPGWSAIVISGTLFGLAHFGHGVAPIPLILLGVVLGYVYQRTHRIVPCIACHALFNGLSLFITWLAVTFEPATR